MVDLLNLTGTSTITKVNEEGGQRFDWSLVVSNPSSQHIVTIDSAYLCYASRGGWIFNIFPELISTNGNFLGLNRTIPKSSTQTIGPLNLNSGEPAYYVIVIVHVTNDTGEEQDIPSFTRILRGDDFSSPESIDTKDPVFLGFMEPIEVISIPNVLWPGIEEKKWLTIMGQLINGTGRFQQLTSLHYSFRDVNNTTIKDEPIPFDSFSSTTDKDTPLDLSTLSKVVISNFLLGFEVPNNFTEGTLRVKGETKIQKFFDYFNYRPYKLSKTITVKLAPVETLQLKAPFEPIEYTGIGGLHYEDEFWRWGNGPGVTHFHVHSRPEGRYSYDLGIFKSEQEFSFLVPEYTTKVTHFSNSNPQDNSRFFCFNKPILCMHEGVVLLVRDAFPDNFGLNTPNQSNTKMTNNVIVIQHTKGNKRLNKYSKYYHLRQNSAQVKNPTPSGGPEFVTAGQLLGFVGNVGISSEPHLHIGYFEYDTTGRLRALPMRFLNIEAQTCFGDLPMCKTFPMTFVPQGSQEYNVID